VVSKKAGDMPPKEGWSKWEVMASAVLAIAATGSFLVASTMTSPSFSPKIIHQRGGGGGGKPGGSSASPTPKAGEDEESEVSVLVDESGGATYQVSVVYLFFAVENYSMPIDTARLFFDAGFCSGCPRRATYYGR
jgi:hypothetical protein